MTRRPPRPSYLIDGQRLTPLQVLHRAQRAGCDELVKPWRAARWLASQGVQVRTAFDFEADPPLILQRARAVEIVSSDGAYIQGATR